MKRFLNWKIWVPVIAVLIAGFSFCFQGDSTSEAGKSLKGYFPEFSDDSADQIILTWKNNKTTLYYKNEHWFVKEREDHAADHGKIIRLLEMSRKMRPLRLAVPADPESCSALRVNVEEKDPAAIPGLRVRILDAKGNILRDYTLGVGYFSPVPDESGSRSSDPIGRWAGAVKKDGTVIPFLISAMFEEFHPVPGGWMSCPSIDNVRKLIRVEFSSGSKARWMIARLSPEDAFVSVIPGKRGVPRQKLNALFSLLSGRYTYEGLKESSAGKLEPAGVLTLMDHSGLVRRISFFRSAKAKGGVVCRVEAFMRNGEKDEKRVQAFLKGRSGWLYAVPEKLYETLTTNPAGE